MKPIKLRPKRTPKGWSINIPPILSETCNRRRLFFRSRDEAEQFAAPIRKSYRSGSIHLILPSTQSQFAVRAFEILGNRPPEMIFEAVKLWMDQREQGSKSVTFVEACEAFVASPFKTHLFRPSLLTLVVFHQARMGNGESTKKSGAIPYTQTQDPYSYCQATTEIIRGNNSTSS